MPAINFARLKSQVSRLSEKFGDPAVFMHDFHELLDFYTNRTIHKVLMVHRLSLPTFHTPRPVLRQIESELKPLADTRPLEATTLINALWEDGSLESRLLATRLLGNIPPTQAMSTLSQLPDWLAISTDNEIRQALLTDALARLRCENAEALFLLLEQWLKSPRSALQIWGMQALVPLLNEPDFENLPAAFRILRPAIEAASPSTQLDLQTCLVALSHVSLTETLYYLNEILNSKPNAMLLRTLRRILPALPLEMQLELRVMLREAK